LGVKDECWVDDEGFEVLFFLPGLLVELPLWLLPEVELGVLVEEGFHWEFSWWISSSHSQSQ
jgi:hypothetical protein